MQRKRQILKTNHIKSLLQEANQEESDMLGTISNSEIFDYLVSKINYSQRKHLDSCEKLGVHIRVGDICYIDYGMAYLYEIGYLHFGLVLSMRHGKAFVVPVSGSQRAYRQAYSKENPRGKRHMMRLGKVEGLAKPSVLYINDAKWINTARVIDVKAHIQVQDALFKEIKQHTIEMI